MCQNKNILSCNHPHVIACDPLFASVETVSPPVLLILTNSVSFRQDNCLSPNILISYICVSKTHHPLQTKHEKQASI